MLEYVQPEHNSGCWLWTGHISHYRYGMVGYQKKRHSAHRLLYELLVGPVPAGLDLDHLCRVRSCVNPAHLEPVDRRTNLLRGVGFPARYARQTVCKSCHAYTNGNMTAARKKGRVVGRACKACWRAWYWKNRERINLAKRARRAFKKSGTTFLEPYPAQISKEVAHAS